MKKTVFLIMIYTILVCLTDCGAKTPAMAADGTPWSEDWTMIGQKLGVEDPGHGFTIRDIKGAKKMYFTSWSIGDAQPYVSAEGEETNVYDAQLVFLLVDSAESAQANVDEWLAMARDAYSVTDTTQHICNGQEFTVLTYTISSDTNPYARGASAFTVFDNCAVSAEFACQDAFEEDAEEILTDFLEHCHYAVE